MPSDSGSAFTGGTCRGAPDLVFPAKHAVILVHGCFWHGHNCPMCKMPTTRASFWEKKITGNAAHPAPRKDFQSRQLGPAARWGRVPGSGVGAVGKWPAEATDKSLAQSGHLSTAVVIASLR
jgi:hypothetical protein